MHVRRRFKAMLLGAPEARRLQQKAKLVVFRQINFARDSIDRPLLANQLSVGAVPITVHLDAEACRCMTVEVRSDEVSIALVSACDGVDPIAIRILGATLDALSALWDIILHPGANAPRGALDVVVVGSIVVLVPEAELQLVLKRLPC